MKKAVAMVAGGGRRSQRGGAGPRTPGAPQGSGPRACRFGAQCQSWQLGKCRFGHINQSMTCTRCGKSGHPAATCTNGAASQPPRFSVSGKPSDLQSAMILNQRVPTQMDENELDAAIYLLKEQKAVLNLKQKAMQNERASRNGQRQSANVGTLRVDESQRRAVSFADQMDNLTISAPAEDDDATV